MEALQLLVGNTPTAAAYEFGTLKADLPSAVRVPAVIAAGRASLRHRGYSIADTSATVERGSIEAEAWVTDRVPPGMVYANFHFPEANANELTQAALDPVAKIPEYKISAVKVERVDN